MDGMLSQTWRDVGAIDDIPQQGARTVASSRGQIAIFRTIDDEVFAVVDSCPHKGGRLSQGIVHGKSVTCPLHSWVIGLEDGCAKSPDEGCIATVAVKLDGRRVMLGVGA